MCIQNTIFNLKILRCINDELDILFIINPNPMAWAYTVYDTQNLEQI